MYKYNLSKKEDVNRFKEQAKAFLLSKNNSLTGAIVTVGAVCKITGKYYKIKIKL